MAFSRRAGKTPSMKHEILIVGGGASGVLSALMLKDRGYDVAILEAKDRILKKLLATGNGRCNITNAGVMGKIADCYTTTTPGYDFAPLHRFPLEATMAVFQGLGLHLTTLDQQKMYPLSLQASSVVDILRMALDERGIPVYLNAKVLALHPGAPHRVTTADATYQADRVILSTGGAAMPASGSDGSFLPLLKGLGYPIVPPAPALVQLHLESRHLRGLAGVKFEGHATLLLEGQPLRREEGEILFTDYGISGPPILQLSRFVHPHLAEGRALSLKLDLFPEHTTEDLENLIWSQVGLFPQRSAMDALRSLLHGKLLPMVLKSAGLDRPSTLVQDVPGGLWKNLATLLKAWQFPVVGTQPFKMAQGTFGGVALTATDENLQSRLHPGIYFTGEVLDVLGACGGYNLQWAWSTAGTVVLGIQQENRVKTAP